MAVVEIGGRVLALLGVFVVGSACACAWHYSTRVAQDDDPGRGFKMGLVFVFWYVYAGYLFVQALRSRVDEV